MKPSRVLLAAAVVALAFAIAFPAPAFAAAAARVPSAVGALRVASLAELILKLHGQLGQAVLVARGRRALGAAIRELDLAVRALGMPPPPSELHERVAILALLVDQYRGWALRKPSRDVALALAERAEELEWEAQRLAGLAPPRLGSEEALAASAVAAGGEAERIARLLLWQHWGIARASAAEDLSRSKAALQSRLAALREAPQADAATRAELQVAENQASFLFAATWSGEGGRRSLEYAVKASDNARESLERLAGIYLREAAR